MDSINPMGGKEGMLTIRDVARAINALEDVQLDAFSKSLDKRVRDIVGELNTFANDFKMDCANMVAPYVDEIKDVWEGVTEWYNENGKLGPKLNKIYCS